jgi:transposase-like protein
MADADLHAPEFTDEAAAIAHVEASRWPDGGVTCPHCGSVNVHRMAGKTQAGYFLCNDCRDKFTCRTGTVMERSHIPVHKWLLAIHLLSASKKGMSAHQLHRMLGVTYKSAWFLAHRIREAMRPTSMTPMGGEGKVVEIDETYIGKIEGATKKDKGGAYKNIALTLVERGGSARTFHIANTALNTIMPIIYTNIRRESIVMTDEARWYQQLGGRYFSHDTVNHSQYEYVRGDISTNTVEGYYSIFKRGMKGIYQHCAEKHLHRYLSEFDFRYSYRVKLGYSDGDRAAIALKGIEGKRLTYRRPHSTQVN